MEFHQLNLFTNNSIDLARAKAVTLSMDSVALAQWKTQVFEYQQRVRESQPPQQTTLFDLAPIHCDPNQIDKIIRNS